MTSAIILAGGTGNRMNSETPKQFLHIKNNMMIVDYSINTFKKNSEIDEIIIVCHKDWTDRIASHENNKCNIVIGGESRTESVLKGLLNCKKTTKNVLIHDAARPFITEKLIIDSLNNLNESDASIPVLDCDDSLINTSNIKIQYLDRTDIKFIQTPQGFKYDLIFKAYNNMIKSETDDLQILLQYKPNALIKFIKGSEKNFKITTEYEIKLLTANHSFNNPRAKAVNTPEKNM